MKPVEELRAACERTCRAWQEVLRLQDWNVDIVIARYHGFEKPGSIGQIDSDENIKEARLRLLDPRDNKPEWSETFCDLEVAIVHELLHLHMEPFSQREVEAKAIAEEQAVDLIAWALVKTARRVTRVLN